MAAPRTPICQPPVNVLESDKAAFQDSWQDTAPWIQLGQEETWDISLGICTSQARPRPLWHAQLGSGRLDDCGVAPNLGVGVVGAPKCRNGFSLISQRALQGSNWSSILGRDEDMQFSNVRNAVSPAPSPQAQAWSHLTSLHSGSKAWTDPGLPACGQVLQRTTFHTLRRRFKGVERNRHRHMRKLRNMQERSAGRARQDGARGGETEHMLPAQPSWR